MSQRKSSGDKPEKAPAFRNEKLKNALGKWKTETQPPKPPPPRPAPPPAPPPPSRSRGPSGDDDALFRMAMEDVSPLKSGPALAETARHEHQIAMVNEDAEALARLAELVATGEGIDLADTDEYVEGAPRGVDASLLLRLRRGDFSVQSHVDLHGLGAEAAKAELEKFILDSRKRGYRCVLVVHGRGLHSKDQIPVLKERVGAWLSRGKLARIVLAFATARPTDGGAGALYVLIRR